MSGPDITAVLLAHDEGPTIGISLKSVLEAAAAAREDGVEVEVLVALRRPDPATRTALAEAEALGARVLHSDAPGPSEVCQEVLAAASGRYVSILRGGDLWSLNWLRSAYAVCESDPGAVVAHPEVSWLFDGEAEIFFGADQTDPAFDARLLRVENPWDAACLAPPAYAGPADEAWQRHSAGLGTVVRRVAPDTIHFVRRPDTRHEADRPGPPLSSEFLRWGWAPGE
jgi:hypothetical protein